MSSLKQQHYSVREIGRVQGRSASTISRELRRNALGGQYASTTAKQDCLRCRAQARRMRNLHHVTDLFGGVHQLLCQRWSPKQISLTMAHIYPKGHEYRGSQEAIYNFTYAQSMCELRKNQTVSLRHAHNKPVQRSKRQDQCDLIPEMLSINVRTPEVADRKFPDCWDGHLISGKGNASAVGNLVERTCRMLILVKLLHPKPASAANTLQASSYKLIR